MLYPSAYNFVNTPGFQGLPFLAPHRVIPLATNEEPHGGHWKPCRKGALCPLEETPSEPFVMQLRVSTYSPMLIDIWISLHQSVKIWQIRSFYLRCFSKVSSHFYTISLEIYRFFLELLQTFCRICIKSLKITCILILNNHSL